MREGSAVLPPGPEAAAPADQRLWCSDSLQLVGVEATRLLSSGGAAVPGSGAAAGTAMTQKKDDRMRLSPEAGAALAEVGDAVEGHTRLPVTRVPVQQLAERQLLRARRRLRGAPEWCCVVLPAPPRHCWAARRTQSAPSRPTPAHHEPLLKPHAPRLHAAPPLWLLGHLHHAYLQHARVRPGAVVPVLPGVVGASHRLPRERAP